MSESRDITITEDQYQLVTEEIKDRPSSQSEPNERTGTPKPVVHPSCLKKTQKYTTSKYPLFNFMLPKRPHDWHRRPQSMLGYFQGGSGYDVRDSPSTIIIGRSRSRNLFRSLSAGRMNDYSLNDSMVKGSSTETVRKHVQWDPSSEMPKKRRSSSAHLNRSKHMILQESNV